MHLQLWLWENSQLPYPLAFNLIHTTEQLRIMGRAQVPNSDSLAMLGFELMAFQQQSNHVATTVHTKILATYSF